VVVAGLAPGSTLSVGVPAGSNTWRLATEDLGDVVLAPPRGFVGAMDLRLELRLGDQTAVDRKALQLEWSARDTLAPPKSRRFGAAEIASMIEKGAALIGIGNVRGARMVLQRAAEAGDPAAAFALAETYDPLVLKRLDVKGGITSNIALANIWYEKAKDLGSIMASERLKSLAGLAK
jgi:TPR repeat protein